MIIMDMDHFNSVNDNYGHDVGDEVLKQLAKIIIDSTRSADLSARYGGEEFVMLMPETDFKSAREVAERMRKKVESHPFVVKHEVGQLQKTVSIGISALNMEHDTPEQLLKRADTALYQAKNSGRNQVCPADEAEAQELAEALQHMDAVVSTKEENVTAQSTAEDFPFDQNLAFKINQQNSDLEETKEPVIYEVFGSDDND